MSHKVHPKSFRLGGIAAWDTRGFYGKNAAKSLEQDFQIRRYLQKRIGKLGVEKIEIERYPGKITIIINSGRPGLIIGRGGQGLEDLKKGLEKEIGIINNKEKKLEIKLEIKEIRNPWTSAALTGQWVASQIEKRTPFRKLLKQTIEKVMAVKENKGVRVEVAGRLDGSEIARTEWLKKGRMPRQTLRSDIDFAKERAYCTYGVVGIKIWIYKGDRFD